MDFVEKIVCTGITAAVSAAVIKAGTSILAWFSSVGLDPVDFATAEEVISFLNHLEG